MTALPTEEILRHHIDSRNAWGGKAIVPEPTSGGHCIEPRKRKEKKASAQRERNTQSVKKRRR